MDAGSTRAPLRARCFLLIAFALALFAQGLPAFAQAALQFDILEFEIEGNTRLKATQVEAAVMPFMGEKRDMAAIEGARAALEKAYQNAGYLTVFVDVPEQRIDGGVVRLAVLEGRVDKLYVTGSRYFDQGRIRAVATELAEGTVPNFNVVQQQVAALSQTPERRVQPVLRPGREPGTVEAELKVTDKLPLGGSVEVNNAAAAGTEALRAAVNLHYDNLFQRDHSLSLTALTAPMRPSQSQVLVLNYLVPLGEGDSLSFSAVNSSSDIDSLGGTRVLGKGTTLGLRYGVNRVGANAAHGLSLGFDLKDLTEDVQTSAGTVGSPLRYAPLQAAYNGSWWGEWGQQQLSASATFGLRPVWRQTRNDCQLADGSFGVADQFACKRRGADGGFTTLKLDWRGSTRMGPTEWALRVAGQIASQPLVSAEQFAVGGADSVRGYAESAASADYGVLASLELRSRNLAPALLKTFEGANLPPFTELVVFGFGDVARVALIEPEPGQPHRSTLLGTGVGVRLGIQPGLSLALDWARRHRDVAGRSLPTERVHVRAALRF
ncbi:ShlB/FhaC/HecB family hemolysin secretion/activation protein [Roseateles sp. DXS20W]|uniref:ShlB/FhaC/HecB family hemolysin secretion/activation protein n=1 Tax=Pelomonas lactea TaxID=3299030 RepID=A0ABW7GDQ7_9BURK